LDGVSPAIVRGISSRPFGTPMLSDIADVEKLRAEPVDVIEGLWRAHTEQLPRSLGGVMQASSWDGMSKRLSSSPMLVLPIVGSSSPARPDAPQQAPPPMTMLLMQWKSAASTVVFTSLEDYKRNPMGAPILLSHTFFTELVPDKGIVLIKGHHAEAITTQQAKAVTNLMQVYYLVDSKYKWAERFNSKPAEFDFQAYLNDMDTLA
jgi:ATP synthase F1 complex assembly factor 1